MPISYDIYPGAFVDFIKTTLYTPISKLAEGFPWDFSTMVIREAGSWQDVMRMDPGIPYFDGRFLKTKTGAKSDGSQVFSPPKAPIEFVMIIDRDQWLRAEEYNENPRSTYEPAVSMCSVCTL